MAHEVQDGRQGKPVTFGQFPEMSLKDARKKRDDTRELVAAGIDPIGYWKQLEAEKAAAELRKAQTFQNIANEWFDKQTCSPGYLSKVRSQIEKYAFTSFGQKHIGNVNRQDVLDTARAIEKLGAIESARRFIQRVGQILRYGMDSGYNQYDVTVGLIRVIAKPVEAHRSYLQDKTRIGQFLRTIDAYGGYQQTRAALSLAPLLMVRPGELVKAK